ncbi:MAG TPA: serine/threonine-protein kinase [Polyangium sp.]|nr:serine/threonine-protein kinase [Polyangium sp.]
MPSSPLPSQPDIEVPKLIGRYEVLRLIGEGSMGRVFCAHDPVLGRDVAVKLLRDDLAVPRDVREGLLARMRNEARAAARVAHPNLVTLHDMGEDPQVGLYLVFEYVEGPTLKQRLLEGPLSPADTARLARELGSALTCAHNEGILHRDVKPENVILSRTGGKIADFGIARIPNSTLTHAGGLMGTPAYSAPETFGGKNFSPASDQFSLAALLYEALRGERAFPGDDAVEVAARIANDPPEQFASARNLPGEVDEVLLRAMARSPLDRFPSCEALGELLSDALAPVITPPPRAMMTSSSGRMPIPEVPVVILPPQERRWGQVVLGASVVTVTAALLVHTAMRHEDDPRLKLPTAPSASVEPSSSVSERPRASSSPSSARVPRIRPSAEVPTPIEDGGIAGDGGSTGHDGGGSDVQDAGGASNSNATPALSASMSPASSAPTSTPSSAPARPASTASAPTNDARRLP